MAVTLAATYDEAAAKRYTWASSYAYCTKLAEDDCGQASQEIKDLGWEVLSIKQTGKVFNFINAVIIKDFERKELIVAFSGTQNPAQLAHEIVGSLPTSYSLHPEVKGARVLGYFYSHYTSFSDWLEDELRDIGLVTYKLVFTGHSLGGALAVHAATDIFLQDFRHNKNFRVYTLGQPRVGNREFSAALTDQITDNFRIVHNKDLVVHVPPCIPRIGRSPNCIAGGLLTYYPYHTLTEIFYNDDETEYKLCDTEEQGDCSDKYHLTSVDNHLNYFGIHVGGASSLE
jgi:hypothetical protein